MSLLSYLDKKYLFLFTFVNTSLEFYYYKLNFQLFIMSFNILVHLYNDFHTYDLYGTYLLL